jgi:hypothetical protein
MAVFTGTKTPLIVGGLMIWLDANDPFNNGTQPANGAAVSSWVDKSGTGNNFAQASGGAQPTYTVNSTGILSAVTFNGSSQYMTCPNSAGNAFSTTTSLTIFAVCLTTNANTNHIIAKGAFPSGGWAAYCNPTAYYSFVATNVNQYENAARLFTANSYQIYTAAFNSPAGVVSFSKNGGALSSVFGSPGSASNSQNVTLGVDNGLSRFWSGPIGEVIVYNRVISLAESVAVNLYLQNKWGLR